VTLYPNPARNRLLLRYSAEKAGTLRVTLFNGAATRERNRQFDVQRG
jgi:hypothetical protein